MTFLDLFAGIGGFRRGMEIAGHKCLGFCETDKYAVASYTAMHCITEDQRAYLETLEPRQRQREILKSEYRNGEWYADDIRAVDARSMPRANCWCFGFPCQDISVAGAQAGFGGSRSSLFFAVTKLIRDLEEKDRPEYLFIENVRNLLSINGGGDFLRLLIELDEVGYDAEWQVLNSKDFGVPQNRERVFIIGHLRGAGTRQVFPIEGADGENSIHQIGMQKSERNNPNQYRVYDATGIGPTLNKMDGGGREPCVAQFCDLNYDGDFTTTENARALKARYYKGVSKHKAQDSGIVYGIINPQGRSDKKVTMSDCSPTLRAQAHGNVPEVTLKVKNATKDGYAEAHEGDSVNLAMPESKTRRGRVGGAIVNTLDTSCNQGIVTKANDDIKENAIWSEECQCNIAIRKLTPRECFRLQGWEDRYFDRAVMVNSDSQLYKQAGNGVTVPVIYEIAKRMSIEQEAGDVRKS